MRRAATTLALWLAACANPVPPPETAEAGVDPDAAVVGEVTAAGEPAADIPEPPAAPNAPAQRSEHAGVVLPPLPEPAEDAEPGGRRIGGHRELPGAAELGDWVSDAQGPLWRATIQSTGAVALRLHFAQLDLGDGQVRVSEPGDESGRPGRRLTGRGPAGDGEAWSDIIEGDIVVVEYRPGTGAAKSGDPPFRIDKLSHLWRSPLEAF